MKHILVGCLSILFLFTLISVLLFLYFNKSGYEVKKDKVYHCSYSPSSWKLIKKELVGADPATFKTFPGTKKFARDKNNFYYDDEVASFLDQKTAEHIKENYVKDRLKVFIGARNLKGADPASFVLLDHGFSKDKKTVFHVQNPIPNSDPGTFTLINQSYGKDKNNVYFRHKVLKGSHPESHEIIKGGYSKDKQSVFYYEKLVRGADPKTFEIVNRSYAKDAENVYYRTENLEGLDLASWETLGRLYSKDKDNIYYVNRIIEQADYESFKIVEGERGVNAADKNHKYYQGRIVKK